MKNLVILTAFAVLAPISGFAANHERNACDKIFDKIAKKVEKDRDADISELKSRLDKCHEAFGESDYYEHEVKLRKEIIQDEKEKEKKEKEQESKLKKYIVTKFTAEDIRNHEMNFGGSDFVADISYGGPKFEDKSDPDAICKLFGYDEAIGLKKSKVHNSEAYRIHNYRNGDDKELNAQILEKNHNPFSEKKYNNEAFNFSYEVMENVRLVDELVCRKKKSKKEVAQEELDNELANLFKWFESEDEIYNLGSPKSLISLDESINDDSKKSTKKKKKSKKTIGGENSDSGFIDLGV